MEDSTKRARFEALRQREEDGTLTDVEQAELARVIDEVESAEAAYLHPATGRLRAERAQVEAQNAALRRLLGRKEALARRLEPTLAEVRAERRAIEEEMSQIMGTTAAPSS